MAEILGRNFIPDNATFVNIRTNSDIPDSGISYTFYDDVGLIQWDSLNYQRIPQSFLHPNDFNYIQLFFNQPGIIHSIWR